MSKKILHTKKNNKTSPKMQATISTAVGEDLRNSTLRLCITKCRLLYMMGLLLFPVIKRINTEEKLDFYFKIYK